MVTCGVEFVGGRAVGVLFEELIEQRHGIGGGPVGLPGAERDGDAQAGCLAAAEPDVEVDVLGGLVDRDVVDE